MAAALVGMVPFGEHEKSALGCLSVFGAWNAAQPLECLPVF